MAVSIFYIFAVMALVSALLIVFTKNVLYAAFLLVLTLLSVAAVYVYAMAPFLAVVQIMVYIGGVLVLLIFGLMLTHKLSGQNLVTGHQFRFVGSLVSVLVLLTICTAVQDMDFSSLSWKQEGAALIKGNVQQVGIGLMSDYILPFEVIAVLLLVALVGALVLSVGKGAAK